jgi:hypothetical protein
LTREYGKLVVSASEQQLLEGEKRLFKVYGVRAKGKQNLADGKPFDLKSNKQLIVYGFIDDIK